MKIITEEKTIPARTYTETKYIASDGTEFHDEKFCLAHEHYLDIMSHPVFATCFETTKFYDDEYAKLYYFSSEKDYYFFVANYNVTHKVHSEFKKYGAGWYLVYDMDTDYCTHTHIINYDNYLKELEEEFETWKHNNAKKMKSSMELLKESSK